MWNLIVKYKQLAILKVYEVAFLVFMIPVILLGISIVDMLAADLTAMFFWVLFLLSLIPCGLIGLVLILIGVARSYRKQMSLLNKAIGFIGAFLSLFCMLLYVVLS